MDETVKHLRTIHFSLVAIGFGLLVVSSLGRDSDASVALEQLAELESVVDAWNPSFVESGVRSLISRGATEVPPSVLSDPAEFTFTGQPFRALRWTLLPLPADVLELTGNPLDRYDRRGPFWVHLESDPRGLQFYQIPAKAPLVIPQPGSLADFERIWNVIISQSLETTWVESDWTEQGLPWLMGIRVAAQSNFEVLYDDTLQMPLHQLEYQLNLEPMRPGDGGFWTDRTEHEYGVLRHHFLGFIGSAREVSVPLWDVLQSSQIPGAQIFGEIYETDWPPAPLATLFPELSGTAQPVAELDFPNIRAILETQAADSQEQISVFGATIPASAAATWGSPVLIIVQAYFLLTLGVLLRLLASGEVTRVPWIGLYGDGPSKTLTVLSAFGFPTFVVVFLAWQSAQLTLTSVLFTAAAVAACGALGWCGIVSMYSIWRRSGR